MPRTVYIILISNDHIGDVSALDGKVPIRSNTLLNRIDEEQQRELSATLTTASLGVEVQMMTFVGALWLRTFSMHSCR